MPQDHEGASTANENVRDGDTDETVSDVPVLSEATSDNDSDSEDPDDESDDEAIRLHKESISIQAKRENLHFTHHPFKNDNFPPRNKGKQWKGGRTMKQKAVRGRPRNDKSQQNSDSEEGFDRGQGVDENEGDIDSDSDADYRPHYRDRTVPVNRRRGKNRPYKTLPPKTKNKWINDCEEFMWNDAEFMLDFAKHVLR